MKPNSSYRLWVQGYYDYVLRVINIIAIGSNVVITAIFICTTVITEKTNHYFCYYYYYYHYYYDFCYMLLLFLSQFL